MTVGWDIGGVNTKVALVAGGTVRAVRMKPFELQRAPRDLAAVLGALASELTSATPPAVHAVTMTAELSQMFRTKRDGVAFVLDAVETAFATTAVRVFAVDGQFLTPEEARRQPLRVAAANWAATAHVVAAHRPDALLIDVGTTTTDIIPIAGGTVVAHGRTDPDRLASGELVYTGAVRTPVEAVVAEVPFQQGTAGVSAEGFALTGDVHVWRGSLAEADYSAPAPDGRSTSRECCGERLARVVCGDRDMLDHHAVSAIADFVAEAQVARIAAAIQRVAERHRSIDTAVVAGLGAFIAAAAAQRAGLRVVDLRDDLGAAAAFCAPAAAVALLWARTQVASHEDAVMPRQGPEWREGRPAHV